MTDLPLMASRWYTVMTCHPLASAYNRARFSWCSGAPPCACSSELTRIQMPTGLFCSTNMVLLNTHIPFINGPCERATYKNYVIAYAMQNDSSAKWCKAQIDRIERNKFLISAYNISYIARAICTYYIYHFKSKFSYN